MRTRIKIMAIVMLLLAGPAVFAQLTYEDQLDLQAPTLTGETGLFTTVSGDTLKKGDYSLGLYWSNSDYLAGPPTPDLVIPSRRSPRPMDIDEHRVSLSLGYGINDRWEVAAVLPFYSIDQNAGDLSGYLNGFPYAGKFDENGLGNVRLVSKFAMLDPKSYASHVALSTFIELPTGDDNGGIATGEPNFGLGLHWNYDKYFLGTSFTVVTDRDDDNTPRGVSFGMPDEWRADAGVSLPLKFWSATNWINEVNALFYSGGEQTPDNPLYFTTGIRHWFGDSGWALNAGVRTNLNMISSSNNSCPIGGLLGLTYAPVRMASLVPAPPAPVPVPPPPPEPAPIAPPPEPVAPPRQPQTIRTDEINFEPASARLTNIAKAILDDVALRMKQEPTSTSIVIGYTDSKESKGAAQDLDKRRAAAVRDYLVSRHGIDPSRVTLDGKGTNDPAGDNATTTGRKANRRVVIHLILP